MELSLPRAAHAFTAKARVDCAHAQRLTAQLDYGEAFAPYSAAHGRYTALGVLRRGDSRTYRKWVASS
jgi:hypothetical protein